MRYNEREMPGVDEEGWLDYLQTPNFLPPLFELKNQSEIDAWFEENMPKSVRYGVYNPLHNGTLNHAALDYTVRSLTKAGIEVFMSLSRITRWCTTIFKQGRLTGTTLTVSP